MIMIAGTLRVPTKNMDAARSAIGRLISETRKEAGCLDFRFSEDLADPGLLHMAERWTDQATLDAHRQSDHLKEFRPVGEILGITERNLHQFEISSQTKL